MSKVIGHLTCACGRSIGITQEDLGFEEVECEICGYLNYCPETLEEVEKQNSEIDTSRLEATHARIMARGEDGVEFCIKNKVPKDSEFFDLIVAGAGVQYPHATVWVEDEETTSLGYMQSILGELR
jgi:hypothetical protein